MDSTHETDVSADPYARAADPNTALYGSAEFFARQHGEEAAIVGEHDNSVALDDGTNGAPLDYGAQEPPSQVFASVPATHIPLSQQLQTQPLPPRFTGAINLEEIRAHLENFCVQRDWQQFHTPRFLLFELIKNSGELAAFFQRPGMGESNLEFQRGEKLGIEAKLRLEEHLAQCQIAICQLADSCGVDLGAAIRDKLQKNEARYPVNRYRGRIDFPDSSGRSSGGKRKRFTDMQLYALRELAERANWSLITISKEDREKFCEEHEITKERLHNFFNNRLPAPPPSTLCWSK
mmetsp:Transcript_5002/g.14000  ORF Transcript_5002/g.14000 Transcript_5002/m.14000 type:complete len:292 (-) Transcript_5002:336-1211(-)